MGHFHAPPRSVFFLYSINYRLQASSSHGEVNDGNPQEKRGPRARTYEELVEEKRRRTEKLNREDSRGGRKRKREPSPEEEEEDSYDSDDSVVVIPPVRLFQFTFI